MCGGKRDLLPLLLTPLHINLKITSTDFVILKNETQQTQHSQKIVLKRVKGGGAQFLFLSFKSSENVIGKSFIY